MARTSDYKTDLLADLRNDLGYASEYLSAAYADSQEAFLVALRDVAEAQKGLGKVAEQTQLNRENLYRTLSKHGNPTLSTLSGVLEAVGLTIAVVAKDTNLAPVPPTPVSTPIQKANAFRTTHNVSRTYTMNTYTHNVAATTVAVVIGNNHANESETVPLDLLAKQVSDTQEAAQG